MTHQDKRIYKINWLMARVKAAETRNIALDEEKLLAEFCIHFGAGHRYAREYLKDLEGSGRIVRAVGMIVTPEQYEMDKARVNDPNSQKELNSENKE